VVCRHQCRYGDVGPGEPVEVKFDELGVLEDRGRDGDGPRGGYGNCGPDLELRRELPWRYVGRCQDHRVMRGGVGGKLDGEVDLLDPERRAHLDRLSILAWHGWIADRGWVAEQERDVVCPAAE
jgi:hypothetical protein